MVIARKAGVAGIRPRVSPRYSTMAGISAMAKPAFLSTSIGGPMNGTGMRLTGSLINSEIEASVQVFQRLNELLRLRGTFKANLHDTKFLESVGGGECAVWH